MVHLDDTFLSDASGYPMDNVPQDELLAWCEHDPAERYPVAASVVTLFHQEGGTLKWSDTAQALLQRAPDSRSVLERYVLRFQPTSWSGSLAVAMEAPLAPLHELERHPDQAIAGLAKAEGIRLRQKIDAVRHEETEADKHSDERFE